MGKDYSFFEKLNEGKEGEATIINALSQIPNCRGIKNVTDDKNYQKDDIDILATFQMATGKIYELPIEIKSDNYTTGNMFYETKSNIEHGTPGCMEITKSALIAYYFKQTKILYLLKTELFRDWVHENISNFRKREISNSEGNIHYTSEGRLIRLTSIPSDYYRKGEIQSDGHIKWMKSV